MDWITVLGFTAASLTTAAFFPQALKAWKTKSTHDISLGMFLLMVAGVCCWLAYGIFLNNWPMILANAVTLVLAGSILLMKVLYK